MGIYILRFAFEANPVPSEKLHFRCATNGKFGRPVPASCHFKALINHLPARACVKRIRMSRRPVSLAEVVSRYTVAENGCWEWNGSRNLQGYGHALRRDPATGKYRPYLAHRLSYEFYCESIPAGAVIMHTCDNTACINPAHLRIGTHAENMRDAVSKGRHCGNKPSQPHLGRFRDVCRRAREKKRAA